MQEIEHRVLEALRTHLLSPERIELAIEAYRKEREERARAHAKERGAIERELAQCNRTLARLTQMMVDGFEVPKEEYNVIARRRRELEEKLPLAEKVNVTVLHPAAAKRYRQQVEEIQAALTNGGAAGHEAVQLVRSLIDKIVITPEPDRMGLQVFGDLAVLLGNKLSPDGELSNAKAGCGGSILGDAIRRSSFGGGPEAC